MSVMSSLVSLKTTVRASEQLEQGAHRFATLPATCWDELVTLGFGLARGGAREVVSCSMAAMRLHGEKEKN
jgi:hypothetical protein